MSKPRRRKTDASDPLDRLTSAERVLVFQKRLATDVSQACDRWLRARGIKPQSFVAFGSSKPAADPVEGQAGGTPG